MFVTHRQPFLSRSLRSIVSAAALAASMVIGWAQPDVAANESPAPDPIALRVLYVGSPDGARTADFLTFLRGEFTEVGQASYPDFQPEEADPYDVVIFDVEMHPTERSIGIGKQPTLPKDWARATVLVNGPGVILADRQLGAKLDWF